MAACMRVDLSHPLFRWHHDPAAGPGYRHWRRKPRKRHLGADPLQ
jgi:hypothetical protein